MYGTIQRDMSKSRQKEEPKPPAGKQVPMKGMGADYRIKDDGTVVRMLYLKARVRKDGFKTVTLIDGEGGRHTYLLHMLVARTFLKQPPHTTRVRFKDGSKLNCAAANLEWV